MPWHSRISPALKGPFTDNDEFENGDIFQRHTFEWGENNSVILEPRGGQSDCFKCLVSILCFSHLNAAFVQRSVSPYVLSSCTGRGGRVGGGPPWEAQLFVENH